MLLSAAASLVVRPFRGYEALARAAGDEAPTVLGGALRLLFVIGAVVATTAAGRLAPIELFVATFSFAYVPLAQLVAVGVALRAVSRTIPIRRAFALYLAGHGPWLIALLAIAAVCLIAPSPAEVLFAVAPPLVLGALAWSNVLTFACFRRGLGLTAPRAGIATALHSIVLSAIVAGYYLGMGQLGPQLWR
ncbi:MAG: hypothetical protein KF764_17710 [Labilithrix sp.]|nr:hypothetical protein [Labilithrix sp.]